jgi:hypothetical protein
MADRDAPDLERLIAEGRLKAQAPDGAALRAALAAAETDLDAALATAGTFAGWAEAMLYEAGLRCARVIVHAAGFRISADRGHVTAIDAADALTRGDHHVTFVRLHRMRRVRHEFMYETRPDPSEGDLAQERSDVQVLLLLAHAAVEDRLT